MRTWVERASYKTLVVEKGHLADGINFLSSQQAKLADELDEIESDLELDISLLDDVLSRIAALDKLAQMCRVSCRRYIRSLESKCRP